jgi:hypothetical protein
MMTRKELAKAKAQAQRFQAQRLDELAKVREQIQRCMVPVAVLSPEQLAKAEVQAQRRRASTKPSPHPTLLLMGVYYTRRRDTPWKVRIRVDGRMTTMGWYATIDEAGAVARAGQPSRLNSSQ